MNLFERQLRVLHGMQEKHRPARRRAADLRKHLRQDGISNVVPEERIATRRKIAEAVGDPFFHERLMGTMDLLSVNFLERGAAISKSICRLELKDDVGRCDGYATGALVGENLLLTNHHVLPSKEHARRSLAQFDYADDARGEPLPSHTFKLDPDRLFCSDERLDYTLVAVSPESLDHSPLSTFGASTLVRNPGKTILSEHLNIIQHPRGQNKQVAIRHNELTEEKDDFLYYLTDTDHGSSGSAVYNDAWLVVALHVAGVPEVDEKGHYLDKETGKPILGQPSSLDDVKYIANRGVRVSRIYEHLKGRKDLGDADRKLALSVFRSLEEFLTDPLRGAAPASSLVTTSVSERAQLASPARPAPQTQAASNNQSAAGPSAEEHPARGREGQKGYDEMFLGQRVPLPRLPAALLHDVASVEGRKDGVLDYTHFSLVMSRARKVAFFTACNIDGEQSKKIPRPAREVWLTDERIDEACQTNDALYEHNRLDRGHLVRREDPVWGDDAAQANLDTFHFTNCSPQHEHLNQRTWLDLENHILTTLRDERARGITFTGPVFRDTDLQYRDVKIPEQFWKVVVTLHGGKLAAAGYIESQKDMLSDLELAFGTYKTYRVPIRHIEELTKLDFGPLGGADTALSGESGTEERAHAPRIQPVIDVSRETF